MDYITQEALQHYETSLIQACLEKIRPNGREEIPIFREMYEDALKVGRIRERLEAEMRK